jgi:hypothetical protein
MASSILVKVVGFGEAERHLLNTLFQLSEGSDLTYGLWTADSPTAADVVLINVDSKEAAAEMALAETDSSPKFICVGDLPMDSIWCSFKRPLDWGALVEALDAVFVSKIHDPVGAAPIGSAQDEFRLVARCACWWVLTGKMVCICALGWPWLVCAMWTKLIP